MRFVWLLMLIIGTWGTATNIQDGNTALFPIPLQIAVCALYFCLFLERAIREGR